MIVKKPWGEERILQHKDNYVVKEIHVRKGCRLSLQYHKDKKETLFLLSGDGYIESNDVESRVDHFYSDNLSVERFFILPMVPFYIPNRTIHRIGARNTDAVFLEISTTELHDVVRLEDDYGRGK
jgi:mannose-6-phosphate isomerase-like protein (cupin superfamily)